MRRSRLLSVVSLVLALGAFEAREASAAAPPHRSMASLPSSNGFGTVVYDAKAAKVVQFLEHAYRYPSEGKESRNFAFDAYPGLRVGTQKAWLDTIAPTSIEYVPGTGIVHTARTFAGLDVDEYVYQPMGLAENASVTLVKVTRKSGSGAVDVYDLRNFHLGAGQVPSINGEGAQWNAARDCFYEYGGSGVAFAHGAIGGSTRHSMTPDNPYFALLAGSDLSNNDTTSATSDIVPGMQKSLGDLAVGASAWAGFYSVLSLANDAQSAADRVRTWIAGRTPEQLYAAETNDWKGWITPPPAGLTPLQQALEQQSQVVLRMAQVREPGKPAGQVLASIAPGKWNISWVRDMAYAVAALVQTGHTAEAKAALAFQLGADASRYESYVKKKYKISVVRYYGEGREETDFNADGPNIEFDGFGLYLWTFDEYLRKSADQAWATTVWPTVRDEIADVLVGLQEPNGLIAPDSSIWEVHWNGKQRRFAYTTITAAHGLCSAARVADRLGDSAAAAKFRAAGQKARDAILRELRAPDGTLAQSVEGLASGSNWLDAATVEAVNFGLVHPHKGTTKATLASLRRALVPASGRGLMRSNVGGYYDSQEWVFVDFRTALALDYAQDKAGSASFLDFNVAQGAENFLLLSELHDATTADYAGEAPMVGFGAGAYELALGNIGKAIEPTCGAFADEPGEIVPDGGLPSSDAGTGPTPTGPDGSAGPAQATPDSPSATDDSGCSTAPLRSGAGGVAPGLALGGLGLLAAALVRRARKR